MTERTNLPYFTETLTLNNYTEIIIAGYIKLLNNNTTHIFSLVSYIRIEMKYKLVYRQII